MMKKTTILAAILAVLASATAHALPIPQTHEPGGPIKQGQYCWVYTNSHGAGWWDRCDATSTTPRGVSQRGLPDSDVNAIMGGGGGDGGGGR
jgi:hypothetical protein